jgi:hypothetical protein
VKYQGGPITITPTEAANAAATGLNLNAPNATPKQIQQVTGGPMISPGRLHFADESDEHDDPADVLPDA